MTCMYGVKTSRACRGKTGWVVRQPSVFISLDAMVQWFTAEIPWCDTHVPDKVTL